MGIIIRQSVKQSFIAVIALLVGVVGQIFIYTLDESKTYGAAQRILAIVMLVYPILLFGIPQALIKFHGIHGSKRKGYLGNFLFLGLGLFLLFIGVFQIFKGSILGFFEWLEMDSSLVKDYGLQIAILVIFLMCFKILSAHMSTQRRIVWPNIFDNLWTKSALAVIVLLIILGKIPMQQLSWWIVGYYGVAVVGIVGYAAYLGKLNLKFNAQLFQNGRYKEIGRYSAYTGLAIFGSTFATRIDAVMVAGFTDDQMTGVYMLFLFLAGVVDIPARAVSQISGPIISDAHAKGDINEVQTIYSKAARTLMIIGLAVFSVIFLSIGDLFQLTGKGVFYSNYFILFTILGLIKLVPTTLASANHIVLYSKYYRFTLYLTLMLGVTNIFLNYFFITSFFKDNPLTGVSLATAISIFLHYAILVGFIRIKFGIHPFHQKMLVALGCMLFCFGLAYFLPASNIAILNVILRTIVFSVPFMSLIYTFTISEDVNSVIDQLIQRIKERDFKNIF